MEYITHKRTGEVLCATEDMLAYKDFSNVNFEEADLSSLNLQGARFSRANLKNAKLDRSILREASLNDANLSGATLIGADLSHAWAIETDFSGANLSLASLKGTIMSGAKLSGITLSEYSDIIWAYGDFLRIVGSRHAIIALNKDEVIIGCQCESLEWWLANWEEAGYAEGYTRDRIEEYRRHLLYVQEWFARRQEKGDR